MSTWRALVMVFNPFVQITSGNIEKETTAIVISIAFDVCFTSLALLVLFIAFSKTMNGTQEAKKDLEESKFTCVLWINYFIFDVLALPLTNLSLYFGFFYEWNDSKILKFLAEISFLSYFLCCFWFKKINFCINLEKKGSPTRISNSGNCSEYTLKTVIMVLAYIFGTDYPSFLAYLKFALLLGIFLMKNYSDEIICLFTKKFIMGISVVELYLSIAFLTSKITKNMTEVISYVQVTSFLLLMTIIYLKPQVEISKIMDLEIEDHDSGQCLCYKLELLIWIYSKRGAVYVNEFKMLKAKIKQSSSYLFDSSFGLSLNNIKQRGKYENGSKKNYPDVKFSIEIFLILSKEKNEQKSSKVDRDFENYFSKKYFHAIKKFPGCARLRISLIWFLTEFNISLNFSLTELEELQTLRAGLSLNERIFKKKIECSIQNEKEQISGNEHFLVEGISDIKANERMELLIEEAVIDYMHLWDELKQDNTKIMKIKNGVEKFYQTLKKTEKYFSMHSQIFQLNMKSKLLFGMFLDKVLRVKERSQEILESYFSNLRKKLKRQKAIQNIKGNFKEVFLSNSTPLCLIGKMRNGEMVIKMCNKQFSRLINRTRVELVKKNFRKIIPKFCLEFYRRMFDDARDDIVHERRLICFQINDDIVKNIFKVFIAEIKILRNPKGSMMVLKLNVDKVFKSQGKILVDLQGKIFGFNCAFMNIFKLRNLDKDLKRFKTTKDISKDLENFDLHHQKKMINYKRKKSNGDYGPTYQISTQYTKMSDSNLYLLSFIREKFQSKSLIAFVTQEKSRSMIGSKDFDSVKILEQKKSGSEFRFTITEDFIIEGKFHQTKGNLNIGSLGSTEEIQRSFISAVNSKLQDMERFGEEIDDEKIDYAEGIKVRRLVDGYLRDANDFYSDEEEEEDFQDDLEQRGFAVKKEQEKSILSKAFSNGKVDFNKGDLKKFERLVKKNKRVWKSYHYRCVYLAAFSAIFQIVQFLITSQTRNGEFLKVYNLINISTRNGIRNDAVTNIWKRLHDIMVINDQGGRVKFGENFDPVISNQMIMNEDLRYIKKYFGELRHDEDLIFGYIRNLSNETGVLEMESAESMEIISEGESKMFTYGETVNLLYSSLLKVLVKDPKDLSSQDKDTVFFFDNFMDPYIRRFPGVNALRAQEVQQIGQKVASSLQFFFIIDTIRIVAVAIFSLVGLRILYKSYERILSVYYSFSDSYVKKIVNNCLIFSQKFQTSFNEMDENKLAFDDLDSFSEEKKVKYNSKSRLGVRKKKKRGTIMPVCGIYSIFIVASCGYGIIESSNGSNRYRDQVFEGLDLQKNFRSLSASISSLHFYHCLVELVLYNRDFVVHKTPAQGYLFYFVGNAHENVEYFYGNTTLLSKINDEIFQEYNFLFHSDICDVHNQVKDKEEDEIRIDCEKFKESWKIEALVSYLDKIDGLYQKANYINFNFFLTEYPFNTTCNQEFKQNPQYYGLCLLTSKEVFELNLFHQNFHKPILVKINRLGEKIASEVAQDHFARYERAVVLIWGFSAFWVFCYALVVGSFAKKVWRAKRVLSFHDSEILIQNRDVYTYFTLDE